MAVELHLVVVEHLKARTLIEAHVLRGVGGKGDVLPAVLAHKGDEILTYEKAPYASPTVFLLHCKHIQMPVLFPVNGVVEVLRPYEHFPEGKDIRELCGEEGLEPGGNCKVPLSRFVVIGGCNDCRRNYPALLHSQENTVVFELHPQEHLCHPPHKCHILSPCVKPGTNSGIQGIFPEILCKERCDLVEVLRLI